MRMKACALLAVAAMAACSPGRKNGNETAQQDTLTERQRDSIIAHSKLPNAKAVDRGMKAADAEAAHNAAIDSANAEASR